MTRAFYKMHGIGNDYIYFDCLNNEIAAPAAAARELSDRHFSIGGDGIVLVCSSEVADAKMRMFNSDGSEAQMCGNAIRCVGKLLHDELGFNKTKLDIETLGGIKHLELTIEKSSVTSVTVNMGKAEFAPEKVPVNSNSEFIDREVEIGGIQWRTTALSMGNPHTVTFIENVKSFPLFEYGPLFENNSLFPERVNSEFACITEPGKIEMRVWERGSGETLACGTGACATAAAAVRLGLADFDSPITLSLLGGNLKITVLKDYSVIMEGPCSMAFRGEVESNNL